MQKTLGSTLLGFALALSLVPVASAQGPSFQEMQQELESVGDIEISVSSKAIIISWQGIEIGPNASAWVREKVDGMDGNDPDGVITEEEAELAQDLITHFVEQEFKVYVHDEKYTGHLVIDTSNPEGAQVDSLAAGGIVGDVNSTEGISLSFIATVGFPTRAADVHTVKLDMGRYYFHPVDEEKASEVVGDFTLSIVGTDGWSIDGASIAPDCAAERFDDSTGRMSFTVDDVNCFTGRSGVLLGFSITGGQDSSWDIPGFEAPLLVLGLVGAGLALRRRL